MAYVIGIDGGTESLRAHISDLEGREIAGYSAPYQTDFPEPGRAEQNPEDWWRALGDAVKGALAAGSVAPDQVMALGVDTTCCSVVALDAAGDPIRPAIIWMDVRAAHEANAVAATGDPALRINAGGHGPVSAEWMLPKALWLKRNQPETYDRAARICEFQDFMTARLTGRYTGSLNNLSIRWHYQSDHGGAPTSLLATLDLADLADKWPSEIIAPGDPIGEMTKAAAGHLGLKPGTLVVQGGADAFIGMVGLNVTEPGEMALITGSSHLALGVMDRELHKSGVWGTYKDCVYPDKYVVEGGQTSSGSVIAWFKRHFAPNSSFDELNEAAAALPPGAEGLLVSDHFQGNRTPYTDPLARGAITGLTLKHTPAHVYRAIVEGVCLGTKLIVDAFGDSFTARRVVASGGATNAPFWLQIHADTLGVPIEVTEIGNACVLGSAILAAKGAGRFDTIEEGAEAMVRVKAMVEPEAGSADAYQPIFERYREIYGALKPLRAEP